MICYLIKKIILFSYKLGVKHHKSNQIKSHKLGQDKIRKDKKI